jgi:hypothetical protein
LRQTRLRDTPALSAPARWRAARDAATRARAAATGHGARGRREASAVRLAQARRVEPRCRRAHLRIDEGRRVGAGRRRAIDYGSRPMAKQIEASAHENTSKRGQVVDLRASSHAKLRGKTRRTSTGESDAEMRPRGRLGGCRARRGVRRSRGMRLRGAMPPGRLVEVRRASRQRSRRLRRQ